jgi:hypothetical protein
MGVVSHPDTIVQKANREKPKRKQDEARCQGLMPIILATPEAEIRRILV